ncbi:hypothetical protein Leryth_026430 [Lithospermum erythrorhizon]|nr:hypothetical protein Leryth_026430 [Lithospermum erythrorhizon]
MQLSHSLILFIVRWANDMSVVLRGPKNSREAVKHFGPAPGVPHSHTFKPYVRIAEVRKLKWGKRNSRGFRV